MKYVIFISALIMGAVVSQSIFAAAGRAGGHASGDLTVVNDSTTTVYGRVDIRHALDRGFVLQGKRHLSAPIQGAKHFGQGILQRIGFSFTNKKCKKSFNYCDKIYDLDPNRSYRILLKQGGKVQGI